MKPTQSPVLATPAKQAQQVLQRRQPDRIVYAPNYWQWFAHHRNHGLLPPEIAHCRTQRDEVMRLTSDRFLITVGISAIETERFQSADEVRRFVADLFERLEGPQMVPRRLARIQRNQLNRQPKKGWIFHFPSKGDPHLKVPRSR